MNMKRSFLVFLFISLVSVGVQGQIKGNNDKARSGKGLFSIFHGKGINSPNAAGKSKKEQERTKKKQKKQYDKSVKRSQKRTYEIQSPDVKARMKQNEKDITSRDKEKKKYVQKSSKKAGKKYD
jgi:hypothetical protein